MKRILVAFGVLFAFGPSVVLAQERVDVFPPSAFERSTVFIDLALFWICLIVLLVLIRLKIREIERVQAMEEGVKNGDIPVLE